MRKKGLLHLWKTCKCSQKFFLPSKKTVTRSQPCWLTIYWKSYVLPKDWGWSAVGETVERAGIFVPPLSPDLQLSSPTAWTPAPIISEGPYTSNHPSLAYLMTFDLCSSHCPSSIHISMRFTYPPARCFSYFLRMSLRAKSHMECLRVTGRL